MLRQEPALQSLFAMAECNPPSSRHATVPPTSPTAPPVQPSPSPAGVIITPNASRRAAIHPRELHAPPFWRTKPCVWSQPLCDTVPSVQTLQTSGQPSCHPFDSSESHPRPLHAQDAHPTDYGAHSAGRSTCPHVVLSSYSRMLTTRQSPMVGTYISILAHRPVLDLFRFASLSVFALARPHAACILPRSDKMVSLPIGAPAEEGCR